MEDLYFYDKTEQNEELTENATEKKSLITFYKLNKYFLIPALFTIFNFLSDLIEDFIYDFKVVKNPQIIKSILYDAPNVLAGLFYFIPNFQVNVNIKKKSTNKDNPNMVANYIYNKNFRTTINTKKDIMLILLLSLMHAIDDLLWVFIKDIGIVFDQRLFYLFFIPLFSKIILKQDIYKHQYFSLLISLIGVIFLIIPLCIDFCNEYIVPNILNFIKAINYSLFLVIVKYLVKKFYFPPLKISLIIGIISIIINLIGYTIYCLIINDFSLFTDCLDFLKKVYQQLSFF